MGAVFRHTWGPALSPSPAPKGESPPLLAGSEREPQGTGPGLGAFLARAALRRPFTRGPSTDEPCVYGSFGSGIAARTTSPAASPARSTQRSEHCKPCTAWCVRSAFVLRWKQTGTRGSEAREAMPALVRR